MAPLPAIGAGGCHTSDEVAQCSVASRIEAGYSLHSSTLRLPFTWLSKLQQQEFVLITLNKKNTQRREGKKAD